MWLLRHASLATWSSSPGKARPDTAPDLDQLGTDLPLGVDPSFAYNPGRAWLQQTAPGPKAVAADEVNVAAFVTSALRGKWPEGSWTPVAVAETGIDAAIAAGDELRLTADRIRAEAGQSDITPAAYAAIPRRLLKKGARITAAEDGSLAISGEIEGDSWSLRVKPMVDGSRRWLDLVRLARMKP